MAALPDAENWKEGDEGDLSIIEKCYCPNCGGGNGTTTLLPTKVPLFREIIVMNLACDDCGFRSAEVNFGGELQEKGEKLTWTVTGSDYLNRQIIKSDSASLTIPEIDFEIPPGTQRGQVSTMEGMLRTAADNLESLQPERLRLGDVDNFHRCKSVIKGLRRFAGQADDDVEDEDASQEEVFPFHIILDDPAGNSFIENPNAPSPDPNVKSEKYFRNPSQDMALGLQPSEKAREAGFIDDSNPEHKNVANAPTREKHSIEAAVPNGAIGRQEVIKFQTPCSNCHKPAETDMCVIDIPHFKEVIIMSMLCEACGFRSNEIKGGGGIPPFGTKITLSVRSQDDLQREVLKSDTSGIAIPELGLELEEGGLDGLYTTTEGLLNKMHDRLKEANPFGSGDSAAKQHLSNDGGAFSAPSANHERYLAFLARLKNMSAGTELPFTLVISDPLSNSFVGPVAKDAIALSLQAEREGSNKCYDDYNDEGMQIEEYERTDLQNEVLGLNDIMTEGYQEGQEDYGTNRMMDLPDRLRRIDIRGPDHPIQVGKAPVEGDTTVMGPGSVNFAVPSLAKRGTNVVQLSTAGDALSKILHDFEFCDNAFTMNDKFEGSRDGMVYKDGSQGIGYYTDKPLLKLWEERER